MSLAHQIVRVPASVPAPISPASGRLPQTYESAKAALANCIQLDECQEWADRAAALASYARQANDDELMKMATRIRDRAIRRAGELLKQVDPGHGARDGKREVGAHPPLRGEVASDAGMSPHQAKQAVRVANVPAADFERQVDSAKPPTVTALAEQGKKAGPKPAADLKGRDPAAPNRALVFVGQVEAYAAAVGKFDLDALLPALSAPEAERLRKAVAAVDAVHDRVITRI